MATLAVIPCIFTNIFNLLFLGIKVLNNYALISAKVQAFSNPNGPNLLIAFSYETSENYSHF